MALRTITAPGAEHVSVPVQSGQTLAFTFDASDASFERADDNLTISFENGGTVTLDGFFQVEEGNGLPTLKLQDGAEISAKDFLAAMNPDMDLATAAGPSASPGSSGAGDYADGAGDLIGGLDRLGSLGNDQWSSDRSASNFVLATGSGTLGDPGDGGGENPGSGGGDDGYHTRLVVTDTQSNRFSFFAVDKDGNLVDDASKISVDFQDGMSRYFSIVEIDPVTGKITVELTAEGIAALQNGDYAGDMLIISVDGEDYRMPLIINDDQSYDYVPEEIRANLGPDLKAEWYASDSSTVGDENITLGGANYNRVDIDRTKNGISNLYGTGNTNIDVTASEKSDVNISANGDGNVKGVGANSGNASIRGASDSTITINASTSGAGKTAYGVDTRNGNTLVEGNSVSIEAENANKGSARGVYAESGTADIHAFSDLTIKASSNQILRSEGGSVAGVFANGANAAINLRVDAGGKLVVESKLMSTDEYTGSMESSGSFKALGLSASYGGNVTVKASDIDVKAEVDDASGNGTAAAVYSGWTNGATRSDVTINGYDGVENSMAFNAKAKDVAIGLMATNSGNINVNGGDQNDTISIKAEAERGSAIGVAAQAHNNQGGSKVILDGGAGEDTLNIDARFTGQAYGGNLENFEAPRGAIGVAAAWQQGWGDNDDGAAQVRINNFEKINITADATGSTGHALGIFTRSASPHAPGVYIDSNGKALELTITAVADDSSKAHSIYNFGGTVDIKGGSVTGTSDVIKLTGHMTATGPGANNYITTGSGDDLVSLVGNMNASWGNNSISTGEGADTVSITGNMNATGGSNTVNAGNGDNTVSVGWSMVAQGGNHVNTITSGTGHDEVTVTGQVYASGGGKNVIDTGVNAPGKAHDTLTINYGTVAYGNNSQNHLTSDVITITNRNGDGISTSVGSSNGSEAAETHVTARQNLVIDASKNEGNADGIFSQGDASTKNIINAGTGIDIKASTSGSWGQASGIYANWSSTTDVTTENGIINIDVFSANSDAWGVNGNSNVSLKAEGRDGKIIIGAKGGTNAHGVWSGNYSANELVSIDAFAQTGTAVGAKSASTSGTNISAEKVIINARADEGSHSNNGMINIGDVRAVGVLTYSDAKTLIQGKDISVSVITENFGDAVGMLTQMPDARDKITSATLEADKVYLEAIANGTGGATAMRAVGNNYQDQKGAAANIIKAGTEGAEIVAQSAQGIASGMYATALGALNSIESKGNISVTAKGTDDGNAWLSRGLDATKSGENSLKADGSITITSEASRDALGMYAGGKYYQYASDQASNTVTAKGDVTVNTKNVDGNDTSKAWGVYAENGQNSLQSENGNIRILSNGTGDVRGIVSHNEGENSLIARNGLVEVSAIGGVFGRGVDAWGSDNTIDAKNISITSSMSKDSVAVAATYGGKNTIDSATDITVTSSVSGTEVGSQVSGLWAHDGGTNVLNALDGTIDIKANGADKAMGLYSEAGDNLLTAQTVSVTAENGVTNTAALYANGAGGENLIQANEVSIFAESAEGDVFGMWATSGGVNAIKGFDGQGITVTITAKAGSLGQAYAMLANDGSSNIIEGTSVDGTSDNITITGGMFTAGDGLNSITTGSGADKVSITGDIDGFGNILNTGAGNDVIYLDGAVQSDGFSLDADEGYDTLVLKAGDWDEFESRYGQWLLDNFDGMNVEAIHVDLNGVSAADWSLFQQYFNSSAFDDTSITYTVDGTLYANGFLNEQGDSVLDLGSVLDTLDDNEIKELDLTGGDANQVNIGKDALDNLAGDELLIRGDGNDSVTLFGQEGDWQKSTWDQDSNYSCYTNDDGQQVIVQNGIGMGFAG